MDKRSLLAGKGFLDFLSDRDAEMNAETERPLEPEDAPTSLAKQFGLVFLCGVVVSVVCVVIGFILGYNARPSKSAALEIPPRLIVSMQPASSASIPPVPASIAANSGSFVATDSGSAQLKESAPVSSSATAPKNSTPSATAPQDGSRITRTETTTASGSAANSGGKAAQSGARTTPPAPANFVVQVGSRHSKEDMAQLDHVLRNLGYSLVPPVPDKVAGAADFYRMQVGPYASRELADKAAQKLELEGFQPFVFPAREVAEKVPGSPPAPDNGGGQGRVAVSTPNSGALTGSGRSRPRTADSQSRSGVSSANVRQPTEAKLSAVTAPPSSLSPRAQNPSSSRSASSQPQSPSRATTESHGGRIVDQVLASTSEADVIKKVKFLEAQGFRAFVDPPRAGEKMFRALVGPFDSMTAAEEAGRKLSVSGAKPYIRSWRSGQPE